MRALILGSLKDATLLSQALMCYRIRSDICCSFDDALYYIEEYDYQSVIVYNINDDIDISNLQAVKRIRGKSKVPILVISRNSDIAEKVKLFTAGADDCVMAPFHFEELRVRIIAIVRRAAGAAESVIDVGGLQINLRNQTIRVGEGRWHSIRPKEFLMLEALALAGGRMVTKDKLYNHLYGAEDGPEPKILDVFLCKLRAALRHAKAPVVIQTIWGRGYALHAVAMECAA